MMDAKEEDSKAMEDLVKRPCWIAMNLALPFIIVRHWENMIEEGGRRPIAAGLPINHQEYAGRPDYSGASGQAGMHPDHLITVSCQWNPSTRKIRLDDEFIIGDFTYRVMNISLAEVQIDKDYGILTLNAKRVAGGSVDGNE